MMREHEELAWLRDRGVRLDPKGRIIVRLPAPDYEDNVAEDEREPSIVELMRRDVNRGQGGSRGRRRRAVKPVSKAEKSVRRNESASRVGRPLLGNEPRVCVHTSIDISTRQLLTARGVTLAAVFDAYARELLHVLT